MCSCDGIPLTSILESVLPISDPNICILRANSSNRDPNSPHAEVDPSA